MTAPVSKPAATRAVAANGTIDAKVEFGVVGDGLADDTTRLQSALDTGASSGKSVVLGSGAFRITRPLVFASNTVLLGTSRALGFGCRIEPEDCAAVVIGGPKQVFHCALENLLIWPKGRAADCVVRVDNAYSVTLRNLRVHNTLPGTTKAAIALLGHPVEGGHGPSASILWDNLVVRNDVDQAPVAILAGRECGSHRFVASDLENFGVLVAWRGGQLDFVAPYMERAGSVAVDCAVDPADERARLNTFGGQVDAAASGVACAIRGSTRAFNSYGTAWGMRAGGGPFVYGRPIGRVAFHGMETHSGSGAQGAISGVVGWRESVDVTGSLVRQILHVDTTVAAGATFRQYASSGDHVPAECLVRAAPLSDPYELVFTAYMQSDSRFVLVVVNAGAQPRTFQGRVVVDFLPV